MTTPTFTITDNLAGVANRATGSIAYSLVFSEAVTGLELADFTVVNGTLGTPSGSGNAWTVNVVPAPNVVSGTIGLTLKAGAVSNAAGEFNVAATNTSQTIDTAAPALPRLVTGAAFNFLVDPQVTLQTSLGAVVLELNLEAAPITAANMLVYMSSGLGHRSGFCSVEPSWALRAPTPSPAVRAMTCSMAGPGLTPRCSAPG